MWGRKHRLPKFPEDVIPTFKGCCGSASPDQRESLRQAVKATLQDMSAKAKTNKLLDLRLAQQIAERCLLLLDIHDQRTSQEQALIIGAVTYFAAVDDPFSDEAFASGFHDDARIVNYVLEELGIKDKFIDLT